MQDILLNEICDKCKKQLTLMESVRTEDGSLWLVKRCLSCFARPVEEVVMVCASINEPVPPARLQEICEAERDGRLVVFPVKRGDVIWAEGWEDGIFDSGIVANVHLGNDNKTFYVAYIPSKPDTTYVRIADGKRHGIFGKTVFPTKEAAEDAAKGR